MKHYNSKANKYYHKLISDLVKGNDILDVAYHSNPNPFLSNYCTIGIDLYDFSNVSYYKETVKGDATRLKEIFKNKSFDTIIVGHFIEHVENPYKLIRQCKDLLKDNGRLIVSTPNPLSFPYIIAEFFSSEKFCFHREHKYALSKRWVKRMLLNSGFCNISFYSTGLWLPKILKKYIFLPCPVILSTAIVCVGDKYK